MKGVIVQRISVLWQKIPPPAQKWLKGAEVFVLTGGISAIISIPHADLTNWHGIVTFGSKVAAAAGGCLRLYMMQSPWQNVVKQIFSVSEKTPEGEKTVTEEVVSGPPPV